MAQTFFNYKNGTPDSQTFPFKTQPVLPVQSTTLLNQLNIKSLTEFYRFIEANPKNLEIFGSLTNIYEDDLARIKETTTRKLEENGMVDLRCGPALDPCKILPRSIQKK